MTGLELLDRVRQLLPDLPVAVLTGHPTVDYAVSALRNSAAEFLQKPIIAADLVAKATALIAAGPGGALRGPGDGPGHRRASRRRGDRRGRHPAGAPGRRRHGGDPDPVPRGPRRRPGAARPGIAAGRRPHRRAAVPRRPGGHPHRGGRPDDRRHQPGRRRNSSRRSSTRTRIHDVHQDHRNTHRAAMVACRRVGRVYCFQSPSATVDLPPDPLRDHRRPHRPQAQGHRRVRLPGPCATIWSQT